MTEVGAERRSGSRRIRATVLTVFALLVVAAIFADVTRSIATKHSRVAHATSLTVSGPGTSSVWYCAEGTSSPDGRADESVLITNLSANAFDALVTVMPGGGQPVVSRTISAPARSTTTVAVSDVLAVPEPGVVVEIFGGPALVEHMVRGNDDFGVGPCARQPASRWMFAAGTTVKGAQEWMALLNPFGEDAVVDVTVFTATNMQEPQALQGLAVPAHSRVSLPIHDHVRREANTAVQVQTRTGRVVAERSLVLDGTDERKGLSLSLGVTRTGDQWSFPIAATAGGLSDAVAIVNPSRTAGEVEVTRLLDGDTLLEPQTVPVPARTVVTLDAHEQVPNDTAFSYVVRGTAGSGVVAEDLVGWKSPSTVRGIATAVGNPKPAMAWAMALGKFGDEQQAFVGLINPNADPAHIRIETLVDGRARHPKAGTVTIAPGKGMRVALAQLELPSTAPVVIRSDRPVSVERLIESDRGGSTSAAVPFGP